MKKIKTKEERSAEWFQKYILGEEYARRVQKHDVPELSVKEVLFNRNRNGIGGGVKIYLVLGRRINIV